MNKRLAIVAFLLIINIISIFPKIKLPAIISSNMVLQQSTTVKLWGQANLNSVVSIKPSWLSKTLNVKSDNDGNWIVNLQTPKAGGPYEITFSDNEVVTIDNVLIGEVWLCSGQSNMQMPMKGFNGQPVEDAQTTIAQSKPEIPIRFYKVEKANSLVKNADTKGSWKANEPQNVQMFSAVAYYFAQSLQSALNVPIGIISTSWGGSNIEAWMDSITLSKSLNVKLTDENNPAPVFQRHCQLFNAMIYPLKNYKINGVVWYQGEANVYGYKLYENLMPDMVNQWRKLWNIGDFPFYYAQIAPWKYNGVNEITSVLMCETQQKLTEKIPNSGMVLTIDTGDSIIIHPARKKVIGERFAYLALAKTYNKKGIEYKFPEYKSMKIVQDTVFVEFNYAELGLHSYNKNIGGFEISGSDKKFQTATAVLTQEATVLKVYSPNVTNPIALRYAFRNVPKISLFNNFDQPLAPFRTDNWEE